MPFGISEEYIGLLLVVAVCLITVAIIEAHKGGFSSAHRPRNRDRPRSPDRPQPDQPEELQPQHPRQRVRYQGVQRDESPEAQDQPKQLQPQVHHPHHHQQPRQRVLSSEDFVRARLLPYSHISESTIATAQPVQEAFFQSSKLSYKGNTQDEKPRLCEKESEKFVYNKLKDKAKGQTEYKQYAAIVLFPEDDEEKFVFHPPVETDPNKLFVPLEKEFNNYIMARPNKRHRGTEHAEKIIMRNFESLKRKFKNNNNNNDPAKIILYTEIMSCSDCTKAIISGLSELAEREVRIEFFYTLPYDTEEEDTQTGNRKCLKDNNIIVKQIQ